MGGNKCVAQLEDGSSLEFDRFHFASGCYRRAHHGKYISGSRQGETCVVKVSKLKRFASWEEDMAISKQATEMADLFHTHLKRKKKSYASNMPIIKFLEPEVAYVSKSLCCADVSVRELITVEEFIDGKYKKYISNNGTFCADKNMDLLQAFVHFTFHKTKGDMILVDLQGCQVRSNNRKNRYVLTDPSIHSTDQAYGSLDLGIVGIEAFFNSHSCNEICKGFRRPKKITFCTSDCERIMRSRMSHRGVAPESMRHH